MNCVSNGSKTSNKRGASNQPQDMWDFNGWRIPDTVSVDPFWSWMCVSIGWVSIPTTSKVQLPVLHFNYGKGISCDANTILESYNIISNMYITMYTHNIETQPRYSIIICNLCRTYHYHICIHLYYTGIILFNSTTFLTSASILDRFFYWPQVSLLSLSHSSRRMPQQLVLGESQGTCVPSALLNVESSATKTCTKTAISEEHHNKNRCAKVETSRFYKSLICLFWMFFNQGIRRLLPENTRLPKTEGVKSSKLCLSNLRQHSPETLKRVRSTWTPSHKFQESNLHCLSGAIFLGMPLVSLMSAEKMTSQQHCCRVPASCGLKYSIASGERPKSPPTSLITRLL